ncbi:methylated-DNA--[protein]-cysteine S-methyltransferase [Actinotalea fermentans]|nr:methylated-DNA--[protein]-cysteine S-methyltransferase [Actinotalea fermentans]
MTRGRTQHQGGGQSEGRDVEFVVSSLETPMGPLTVAVDEAGVVHRALFGPVGTLAPLGARVVAPEDLPGPVADAVARYLGGELTALDEVEVRQPGGPFRQAAWSAMRTIPPGETVSYTELAELSGRPAAVRAAGSACATNLVAPFVPCHRVVRSDGSLGGYAYGLEVKKALLEHERRHAGQGRPGAA